MSIPLGFSPLDACALALFVAVWIGFETLPHRSKMKQRSISYLMAQHRALWMKNMMRRDHQAFDALVQSSLTQGIGFFASTSIIVIGGLFAALGATEKAIDLLQDFPLTVTTSRVQWEFKVLLLVGTFAFAFFKFAWSIRLFNYLAILIGAAPYRCGDNRIMDDYAERLGQLHALGARHFSTGINAYFFSLAATAWFMNPWAFIFATLWLALVLYRRTFHSNFARILGGRLYPDNGNDIDDNTRADSNP